MVVPVVSRRTSRLPSASYTFDSIVLPPAVTVVSLPSASQPSVWLFALVSQSLPVLPTVGRQFMLPLRSYPYLVVVAACPGAVVVIELTLCVLSGRPYDRSMSPAVEWLVSVFRLPTLSNVQSVQYGAGPVRSVRFGAVVLQSTSGLGVHAVVSRPRASLWKHCLSAAPTAGFSSTEMMLPASS